MATRDESHPQVVNVHDAKTNLSKLLARVEAGEEIVIGRAGTPIARLIPERAIARRAGLVGAMAGRFTIPDDFDAPDPEIEAMFGIR